MITYTSDSLRVEIDVLNKSLGVLTFDQALADRSVTAEGDPRRLLRREKDTQTELTSQPATPPTGIILFLSRRCRMNN